MHGIGTAWKSTHKDRMQQVYASYTNEKRQLSEKMTYEGPFSPSKKTTNKNCSHDVHSSGLTRYSECNSKMSDDKLLWPYSTITHILQQALFPFTSEMKRANCGISYVLSTVRLVLTPRQSTTTLEKQPQTS